MRQEENRSYEKHFSPGFATLEAGTELHGRYVIGRVIDRGGFGIIYLAQDLQLDSVIAIKEYFPNGIAVRSADGITVESLAMQQQGDFVSGMQRFMSEAQLLSRPDCDGIPKVYECFSENGTAYYTMEYVNGVNLRTYIEKHGTLSAGETLGLLKQMSATLKVMHENHILHRDISPENIMLCRGGRIMLLDFGAAREFFDNSNTEMSVVLKHGFAPLEQYRRRSERGAYTDIYALGASAYFAAVGKVPEDALSRYDDDFDFCDNCKALTKPLSDIIARAAAVHCEDRYQDTAELISAIEGCGIIAEEIKVAAEDICFNKEFTAADVSEMPKELRIGGEYYPLDLETLTINNAKLTNTKISNLRHFRKLKYLNLNDNFITDLSVLSELTQLECLYFNNNNVHDIDFAAGMSSLKKISGENNSVESIAPLSGKTELTEVFFGDNYVTDISPLKDCSKLCEVGFNEAKLDNIEALAGKPLLTMVCFAGCGIKDISPLKESTKLKLVYFGRNDIRDFSVLRSCPDIEELILDFNSIDEERLRTLKGVSVSRELVLNNNGLTQEQWKWVETAIIGNPIIC